MNDVILSAFASAFVPGDVTKKMQKISSLDHSRVFLKAKLRQHNKQKQVQWCINRSKQVEINKKRESREIAKSTG